MGIGGHMLGPRKLRGLSARCGLPLNRAYIRNGQCEGVVWVGDGCVHYSIDLATGRATVDPDAMHWTTCSPSERDL